MIPQIINQKMLVAEYAKYDKRIVLQCNILGRGIEWLGFGETLEAASEDLYKNIKNYITNYESI